MTALAMSTERIAMARRCATLAPLVSDEKIGTQPGGSSTTNSVAKAEMKRVSKGPVIQGAPGRL